VLPGICEEILFRGYIFSGFLNNLRGSAKERAVKAVVYSAVLFGIMHLVPVKIPITFIGGLVLGLIILKTGNILASMFAHIVYNATPIVLLFLGAGAILTGKHLPIWLIIVSFVVLILGIYILLKFSQIRYTSENIERT